VKTDIGLVQRALILNSLVLMPTFVSAQLAVLEIGLVLRVLLSRWFRGLRLPVFLIGKILYNLVLSQAKHTILYLALHLHPQLIMSSAQVQSLYVKTQNGLHQQPLIHNSLILMPTYVSAQLAAAELGLA
jgi:hypothetical protein